MRKRYPTFRCAAQKFHAQPLEVIRGVLGVVAKGLGGALWPVSANLPPRSAARRLESARIFGQLRHSFASRLTVIRVPAGTTIYEGFAAPQVGKAGYPSFLGGGNQVYLPEVDPRRLLEAP
jgi:hypothetical protein